MRLQEASFTLLCMFLLVFVSQSLCHGQSPCDFFMEKWKNTFAQLQEALSETQRLKESSVAQDIRKRVSGRQSGETMAEAIRSVLKEKANQLAEYKEKCFVLAEQEKLAFKEMQRCAVAHPNMQYQSIISQLLKQMTLDRDKAMRDLRYVTMDDAYIQYLNQRPLTQDDYSDNQRSSATIWYSYKASR